MRKPRRIASGAAAAALAFTAAACLPAPPPHPTVGVGTQADDAFAYGATRDGTGDFLYNQIWYFNFLDDKGDADPTNDVAGVAAYGLSNPEKLAGQPAIANSFGMIIRDPSDGGSFNAFSPYADASVPGVFSASETFEPGPGPELQNPYGTIEVVSHDEYHVVGSVTKDAKTITWDLTYARNADQDPGDGWHPWVKWPFPKLLGLVPTWMDYYMQMPNASVDGTFTVDDGSGAEVYTLTDAKGYHDGLHSEAIFPMIEWDWLDYKQPGLAVQLLHPHNPQYVCVGAGQVKNPCLPGNLRVFSAGVAHEFYRGEIDVHYDATVHDPTYGVDRPLEETITATNAAGDHLSLHWSLVNYLPVFWDFPAPINDTITYEIIATFSGTFTPAGGSPVAISGDGWADWSGASFPGS